MLIFIIELIILSQNYHSIYCAIVYKEEGNKCMQSFDRLKILPNLNSNLVPSPSLLDKKLSLMQTSGI